MRRRQEKERRADLPEGRGAEETGQSGPRGGRGAEEKRADWPEGRGGCGRERGQMVRD